MTGGRVENINPPTLAPARGYSHASLGAGLVFVGGQIGCNANGVIECPDDMPAQFDRAIRNVGLALEAAGCAPADAIKITYYVTDVDAYRAALEPIGDSYRSVFAKHYPATSLFEVKGLFDPAAMIEIECIAVEQAR